MNNRTNLTSLSFLFICGLMFVLLINTGFSNLTYTEQVQVQPYKLIEMEKREIIEIKKMLTGEPATADYNIKSENETIQLSGKMLDEQLKGDLKGLGQEFVHAGKEHEIDPIFLAALAAQETGWGDSLLMGAPWNNVGGMTCMPDNYEEIFGESYPNPGCGSTVDGGTKWQKFQSIEDSIYFKAAYLKLRYLENGTETIEEIQKKYAPSNADNDQTGLNDYWVQNIVDIMNTVKSDIHS
ncbi:glucosaminidase domain-containing protein [Bacillus sp. PS06]|uniref:glucosaminidase domain-containing protein n=1 Tax=Bacillus sp. PS06 TaxID=2764176 RepID=UPI00177D3D28|nr:glucosaminidase domain-containing protein [Bacillus sp. PS06]MBD8067871.1 glucosaminidase domain-containing protein [Bacillus sp. PS06]